MAEICEFLACVFRNRAYTNVPLILPACPRGSLRITGAAFRGGAAIMAKRHSTTGSEACAPKRAGKQGARSSGGKSAKADKQAQDASVLAVEQWQRTFDAVPDLMAILDTQHRIVRINKAMAERLGLAKDQCVGQSCHRLVEGTDEPPPSCPHTRLLQDGEEHAVERHVERLAGDFLVTVSPLRDSTGRLVGSVHVVRDFTDRKRAEEELERERQQFLSIFESIDEAVYVADPKSHELLYTNKATRSLFGENIIGKKCYNVFQNLDAPCEFCTDDKILGDNVGKPYVWEWQNLANQRWYRCIDRAIEWPDGRLVRYEMAVDITDRKRTEVALRESEERFQQVAANAQEWIWEVDADGLYTYASPVVEKILGYSRGEVVGRKHFYDLFHPEDREELKTAALEVFATKRSFRDFVNRCLHKVG